MTDGPFIGIDVAQGTLDVAVRPTGERWQAANNESGIAELVPRLRALGPTLVVLEATGGLEVPLLAALGSAGLPVVAVNPRQVRDFAKATGKLAKTDRLDAHALARFAQTVQPPVRPTPSAETQVLAATLARRRQLLAMVHAEQHRRRTAVAAVRPQLEAHIA